MERPVVATDAHYDSDTSAIYRNIIMAGQGYKDAENGQGALSEDHRRDDGGICIS